MLKNLTGVSKKSKGSWTWPTEYGVNSPHLFFLKGNQHCTLSFYSLKLVAFLALTVFLLLFVVDLSFFPLLVHYISTHIFFH